MRYTLGVTKISRRVVHDQVIGIDALADRAVPQRAEVHLLERAAAEAEHQQHAVGVRVILARRGRQVVVQVFLKRIAEIVLLIRRGDRVVADLDRTISRQKFGPGVGLKAQHGLKQQRMPHLAHALDRGTVARALQAGDLDLQAEQLDALRTVLDPLPAALKVVLDAANQLIGDAEQFVTVDLVDQIAEPLFCLLRIALLSVLHRATVEADRDRAILVLDAHDVARIVHIEGRATFIDLNDHILAVDALLGLIGQKTQILRDETGCRHQASPSTGIFSISATKRAMPCCAAIVSLLAMIS